MTERKQKIVDFIKSFVTNTVNFIGLFIFINLFSTIFGSANTLTGVAIAVAFMTLPSCNLGVSPLSMSISIACLFASTGVACAISLINPWLGFVVNLSFLAFTMLLSCEPAEIKPYISFLITYIFCQTTPVHGRDLLMRMIGLTLGGIVIGFAYWVKWHNKTFEKRTLRQQIVLSLRNPGFIVRMSVGIALSMLVAALFHLQKPLWISIVVMSVTQIHIDNTLERIRHRTFATVVGILLFILLFKILVPEQYDMILVLLFGYLCSFFSQYKYKQIINAISAINASLVLMATSSAIINRVLCLFGGIAIVIFMFLAQKLTRYFKRSYFKKRPTTTNSLETKITCHQSS